MYQEYLIECITHCGQDRRQTRVLNDCDQRHLTSTLYGNRLSTQTQTAFTYNIDIDRSLSSRSVQRSNFYDMWQDKIHQGHT